MKWLTFAVLTVMSQSAPPKPETGRLHPPVGLALTIKEITPSGRLAVEMTNVAGRAIRIWRDSNSWGASRWRVLRVRGGHLETFYQNPNQDFLINAPQVSEILPGKHVEQAFDLNGEYWCAFARCTDYHERRSGDDSIRFAVGDLAIVIYDVPFTLPESWEYKAWYGVATASTTVR